MEAIQPTVSKRVTLFITTLTSFFTPFIGSAVNVALPTIGREFQMNAVTIGWVATSYLLTASMFLVPFGKLADILGRKKIYTWGIILFGLTSLLSALASNAFLLILSRVLQGISASMIFGTGIAILTSVFPAQERGKALGINVASTYLGLSIGPVIGGLFTHYLGWRYLFVTLFLMSLTVLPFIFYKMKSEWADAKGEKYDYRGAAIIAIGLFALMYGFTLFPSINGLILLTLGIVCLITFFWWEQKTTFPVMNVSLFRQNTVFVFSNLAAFINYSATFAVGFLLSLYLQYIKGFNPQHAGMIMVAQPLVMALFSPVMGRISDKIEPRLLASAGMGLTTIGLILFVFIGFQTSVVYIISTLVVIGLGFALFSSPNTNAVMSSVERKNYGVASATLGTMRLTGQAMSMGIAMLIFSLFIGKVKISPENYPQFLYSIRFAFSIFSILCIIGVFASMARGKLRKNVSSSI